MTSIYFAPGYHREFAGRVESELVRFVPERINFSVVKPEARFPP